MALAAPGSQLRQEEVAAWQSRGGGSGGGQSGYRSRGQRGERNGRGRRGQRGNQGRGQGGHREGRRGDRQWMGHGKNWEANRLMNDSRYQGPTGTAAAPWHPSSLSMWEGRQPSDW